MSEVDELEFEWVKEASKRIKPSSLNSHKARFDTYFKPFLEKRDISLLELTHEQAKEFAKWLEDERNLKPTSINSTIGSIRAFYSYLIREEKLSKNPFSSIYLAAWQ